MQFPVPPGSQMKLRIGMTVPSNDGCVKPRRLPHFHERNFDVRKDLRHGVWIESKSKLHSALVASGGNSSPGMFRADVEDSRLSGRDASIIAVRSDQGAAWSADMRSTEHVVRQVISYDDTISPPRRLVVVVDGSDSMRGMADGS
jgi:hypothetical protein